MDKSIRSALRQKAAEAANGFVALKCHVNFFAYKSERLDKRKQRIRPVKSRYIRFRVAIAGMRSSERSTSIRVANPHDFDPQTLLINGDPISSARLVALKADVERIFNERLYLKRSLNPIHIADMALGLCGHEDEHLYTTAVNAQGVKVAVRGAKPVAPNVLGAIQHYLDQKALLVGNGIAPVSLQRYRQYGVLLSEFISQTYGKHTALDELTPAVEYDLLGFLKGARKYVHNYAAKIIHFFKSILTYAHAHRWVDRNVLAGLRLTRQRREVKTLTISDVEKLQAGEFAEPTLNRVRDIFLFCCYTGLAYTDVKSLAPEHIVEVDGVECILKERNKSGVPSFIPLFPEAIAILNKYTDDEWLRVSNKLLPVISNPKMNASLKLIGNILGIKESLHTHLARKTFTLLAEEKGFDLGHMATMLGHTRTNMTEQHYYKRRRDPVLKTFKQLYRNVDIQRLAS
ncbi:site-specific integrase [Spirosoma koreense]